MKTMWIYIIILIIAAPFIYINGKIMLNCKDGVLLKGVLTWQCVRGLEKN